MKDSEPPAPAALTPRSPPPSRNYAAEKPVADAVFRIYADQYGYDRTPLEPRLEKTDDAPPHWRHEIVSIAPAYGRRAAADPSLPAEERQAAVSDRAVLSGIERDPDSTSSAVLPTPADGAFDFVLMSGRAVAFPIYKYTFERGDPHGTSSWPGRPAPTRPGCSRS